MTNAYKKAADLSGANVYSDPKGNWLVGAIILTWFVEDAAKVMMRLSGRGSSRRLMPGGS